MKLIDILVRELPKRGGWPIGAGSVAQSRIDGQLYFYAGQYSGRGADLKSDYRLELCDECRRKVSVLPSVTREQYEAALAARKQEWSGEGFPPVGCEVEYLTGILVRSDADDNKPENGQIVKVVAHAKYENTGSEVVVATWLNGNGGMRSSVFSPLCLQPIRSEADKKRDEAIEAIKAIICSPSQASATAEKLYEAISTGKINVAKLED